VTQGRGFCASFIRSRPVPRSLRHSTRQSATIRAQQIACRLPEEPRTGVVILDAVFLPHVDSSVPLLLTMPLKRWLDVTAGEPESHEFFACASPAAVPMVSEMLHVGSVSRGLSARRKSGDGSPTRRCSPASCA
jgi:hypothetical protein